MKILSKKLLVFFISCAMIKIVSNTVFAEDAYSHGESIVPNYKCAEFGEYAAENISMDFCHVTTYSTRPTGYDIYQACTKEAINRCEAVVLNKINDYVRRDSCYDYYGNPTYQLFDIYDREVNQAKSDCYSEVKFMLGDF